MSRYTTQIKDLIDYYNNYEPLPLNTKIENALPKIFDFEYPMWSEDYRRKLERKIVMRYFNKEIGLGTPALWKFYLEERLNNIMPLYVEMYKTVNLEYNWLNDTDIEEVFTGNKEIVGNTKDNYTGEIMDSGTDQVVSSVNETTTGDNNKTLKSLKSDFPQATLNGMDYGSGSQQDEAVDKRTDTHNASSNSSNNRSNTSNTNSTNDSVSNSRTNDTFSRVKQGRSGARSLAELNVEYRQSLINIDNMIIEELQDLFMMIY